MYRKEPHGRLGNPTSLPGRVAARDSIPVPRVQHRKAPPTHILAAESKFDDDRCARWAFAARIPSDSSSSPNRPLQVNDMSVPQTATYNVAVSSRLVGATLVGHVTLVGATCPAACAARQCVPFRCSLVTSLDTIVTRWCRVNLCVPCWGRAIGRVCVDGIASGAVAREVLAYGQRRWTSRRASSSPTRCRLSAYSAKGGSDGDSACGEATGEISATKRERGPGGAFCANPSLGVGGVPSSTEYSL